MSFKRIFVSALLVSFLSACGSSDSNWSATDSSGSSSSSNNISNNNSSNNATQLQTASKAVDYVGLNFYLNWFETYVSLIDSIPVGTNTVACQSGNVTYQLIDSQNDGQLTQGDSLTVTANQCRLANGSVQNGVFKYVQGAGSVVTLSFNDYSMPWATGGSRVLNGTMNFSHSVDLDFVIGSGSLRVYAGSYTITDTNGDTVHIYNLDNTITLSAGSYSYTPRYNSSVNSRTVAVSTTIALSGSYDRNSISVGYPISGSLYISVNGETGTVGARNQSSNRYDIEIGDNRGTGGWVL